MGWLLVCVYGMPSAVYGMMCSRMVRQLLSGRFAHIESHGQHGVRTVQVGYVTLSNDEKPVMLGYQGYASIQSCCKGTGHDLSIPGVGSCNRGLH